MSHTAVTPAQTRGSAGSGAHRPARWTALRAALGTTVACVLSACGGGDDGGATGNPSVAGQTSFQAYTFRNPGLLSLDPALSEVTLTEVQQDEVASRSRDWAAATVAVPAGAEPDNGFALPPLRFARVHAVAAAAAGTTLAELRAASPAPSEAAVEAGLIRGTERHVSGAGSTLVVPTFMTALTAGDYRRLWDSLTFDYTDDTTFLVTHFNARVVVTDFFGIVLPWAQVVAFQGVFEHEGGSRVSGDLIRVSAPYRAFVAVGLSAEAVALAGGRWLVRLTPPGTMAGVSPAALASALEAATAQLIIPGPVPAVGDMILPNSGAFSQLGADDLAGMTEAVDPVRADLRTLDGVGRMFVQFGPRGGGTGILGFGTIGLHFSGSQDTMFRLRSDGPATFGSGETSTPSDGGLAVDCGATDVRPGFLAVIDAGGRVEMLARHARHRGAPCTH